MNSALFPLAGPLEGQLPWETTPEDERRFRRVLAGFGLTFVLVALVFPWLPLEPRAPEPATPPEPSLVRVELQPRALPEPVAPKPEPVRPPEPKVVPPPPQPVATRPVATQPVETQPVATRPEPVAPPPEPVDRVAEAREAAAAAGLMAFRDDLQAMRDSVDVDRLNQTRTHRGQASAAAVQRRLVTSEAPAASGGISTAELSTDTGGPALSARKTVAVSSRLATGEASRGARPSAAPGNAAPVGGRGDDAIRRVMDSNKGTIFAIYNRALRKDPLLAGKLVFAMVIEPDGRVSEVTLVSSELADPALSSKILARIRLIDFGVADVRRTQVNYSFDFLPSA